MMSLRLVRRAAAAAAASLALAAATADASAQDTSQVTALVTIVSETGAPVTDLTAADFVVREGTAVRGVARADALHQVPLYLSVLLDISKPMLGTPAPISDMRAGLTAFVAAIRAANPGAQISLTEVSGAAVPLVAFDAKPEDLDAAVARINVGQQVDAVILEGMADAARGLTDKPTIRRAILAIDFGSSEPTRESTMRAAVEDVQKAQATVWWVSIRGSKSPASRREPALKAATEASGGMRLTAVSITGLTSILQRVAGSLSSQYLVTFDRPSGTPVSIDAITVQTKRGHEALVVYLIR